MVEPNLIEYYVIGCLRFPSSLYLEENCGFKYRLIQLIKAGMHFKKQKSL